MTPEMTPETTHEETTRTETRTGRRRRAVHRIVRLREDLRRYRRLAVGLGGALLVAVVVLAALAVRTDGPEWADLGTGVAGIEGSASYYHDALEGRPTASGEPYRASELTAAHRTLPFGSRVRVTHLANGRSVVVRINDRGPFVRRRVLDLSRAAARRLGMLEEGHTRVRLELLE